MLEKEFKVEEKHSATKIGSGGMAVLSTPAMIGFMENTANELAANGLEAGQKTVGIEVNIKHLKATALGKMVRVRVKLIEQKKKVFIYEVEAFAGNVLIGKGQHKRAIVNEEKFMEDLN